MSASPRAWPPSMKASARRRGARPRPLSPGSRERFRKLRDDLAKTGNNDGLVKVDRLVGIESAAPSSKRCSSRLIAFSQTSPLPSSPW